MDNNQERIKSYWMKTAQTVNYESLNKDIKTDVAIIGGGITGITAAYILKKHNIDVAVLEADLIGSGTTGYTTAKITIQHGLKYNELLNKFGRENALNYAKANYEGLMNIEKNIKEEKIECDFKRVPSAVFIYDNKDMYKIEKEMEAVNMLNLKAEFKKELELPFYIEGAVVFNNQAKFHPLKYLYALASKIPSNNCHIYENTKVNKIEPGNQCVLYAKNAIITANAVIIAAGYPVIDMPGFYFAKLRQERSYIISVNASPYKINGMYINAGKPVNSIRMHKEQLLLGGYGHKSGQCHDTYSSYNSLIDFKENRFPENEREPNSMWSAQDCAALDCIPYAGILSNKTKNIYIATGYDKWGMANSNAAALIVTHIILNKDHPVMAAKDLFSPIRFTLKASAKEFIKQGMDAVKSYTTDRINIKKGKLSDVMCSEGKVLRINEKPMAVYRDNENNLLAFEPFCTHLGCTLSFNTAEKSWDCPCHGSRFDIYGKVLEGPAKKPLKKIKIE